MAVDLEIDLTGAEDIIRSLKELGPEVEKEALRIVIREAGNIVLPVARALCPVSEKGSHGQNPGALRKNLKLRTMRRKRGRVGVRIGTSAKGFHNSKQFYGWFQEEGYRVGKRSNKIRQAQKIRRGTPLQQLAAQEILAADGRRFIEGKKFLKKAFDATKYLVKANAENNLRKAIVQAVIRKGRKAQRKSRRGAWRTHQGAWSV